MTKAPTQILEGWGDDCMRSISREVALWDQWEPEYNRLSGILEESEQKARHLGSNAVHNWLIGEVDDGIHAVAESLTESSGIDVVEALLIRRAFDTLSARKKGISYGLEGRWAKLFVLEEGVISSKGIIEEGHDLNVRIRKEHPLSLGQEIGGRIRMFSSRPNLGGVITLEHGGGFLRTFVHGLVNPTDGSPRVKLDIFRK